ncbi:MAG TPA: carboxypeptidase-like regulatory domain-containing protein [Bryobacteraceae bacterium]|nr:carboxypeptidase-like regulatory domain-containing protein [Bryobacteraceae bacterium]
MARITVKVVTTFGESVSGAQVTLANVGTKDEISSSGGEAIFNRVPFGLYDVRVRLAGFLTRTERIRVYQPILAYQIGLELAPRHSYDQPQVSGTVVNAVGQKTSLWVRLVNLYSGDLVENAIAETGKFELVGMAPGKYVLLLFDNTTPLMMRTLDVLGGKQVVELRLEPSTGHK